MTFNLLHQHRDPAWLAAMTDWVRASLAAGGLALVATPAAVRVLPWSAVFRCATTAGDVFFKACAPSQAFEPALMRYLAERRPDDVLPVLAADLGRAWLLLPDGGQVLRHTLTGTAADLVAHWSAVLPRLAALQVDLAGDATHLLSLGVLDRRPAVLPALYSDVLADTDRWPLDHPDGLATGDLPRLLALRPRLERLCAELAALGPADTLVHDDLHDGHIFVSPSADGPPYRFFDFGDACVGHPFFQMIAPQRFYARAYDALELDDAAVETLYEIYLRGWGDITAQRRRALALALAVGPLIRALTWYNALGPHYPNIEPELMGWYARGMGYWLIEFESRSAALDHDPTPLPRQ